MIYLRSPQLLDDVLPFIFKHREFKDARKEIGETDKDKIQLYHRAISKKGIKGMRNIIDYLVKEGLIPQP